jgi:hypothetical protein
MTNRKEAGKAGFGTILLSAIIVIVAIIVLKNNADSENLKAIQTVLKQGRDLHDAMKARASGQKPQTDEDFQQVSDNLDTFVTQLKGIDTSRCPRDFAEAHQRYAMAFAELAGEVRAHPHTPTELEGFARGLESGLEGDPTKATREIIGADDAWKQRMTDKTTRLDEAERQMNVVAARYGAS